MAEISARLSQQSVKLEISHLGRCLIGTSRRVGVRRVCDSGCNGYSRFEIRAGLQSNQRLNDRRGKACLSAFLPVSVIPVPSRWMLESLVTPPGALTPRR